jgi:hypothetical protein
MSGPAATPVTTFWRLAGMTYLQVRTGIVAIFVVLKKTTTTTGVSGRHPIYLISLTSIVVFRIDIFILYGQLTIFCSLSIFLTYVNVYFTLLFTFIH